MGDIQAAVILTTLLILLLIAGVVIVIFIANRRHTQQQISMAQMQLNYEKELRTVEHEVQEQVLMNVSTELHDNIGQLLTVMNIQIEQEKLNDPGMVGILMPIENTLRDTTQQVRFLGRSLNSDLMEQTGLPAMIHNEVGRLKQLNKFNINLEDDGTEPNLDKDKRTMIFRIFQEIINNALKHSGAGNINISLRGKDVFLLRVEDDGKGFNKTELMQNGNGSGLRNIMKRAALANLDCNIESALGKGSIFILRLREN